MPQAKPQKPPLPLWQDGWYSFARRMASPNFGPRPADLQPDLIVIHAISLPPDDFGGDYGGGGDDGDIPF